MIAPMLAEICDQTIVKSLLSALSQQYSVSRTYRDPTGVPHVNEKRYNYLGRLT